MLFSSTNVYGELLVELDKKIVSPVNDPIDVKVKLDYVPQDNFAYSEIHDSKGNSVMETYLPVDQNGYFDIELVGSNSSPIYGGIYVIKVTGINKNNTVTDTNFFTLYNDQQSLKQTETKKQQNSSLSPTILELGKKNSFLKEFANIGITPLLYALSLIDINSHISESKLIFYGLILIGVNIAIYFIIALVLILKLKKYIINRISSKNH